MPVYDAIFSIINNGIVSTDVDLEVVDRIKVLMKRPRFLLSSKLTLKKYLLETEIPNRPDILKKYENDFKVPFDLERIKTFHYLNEYERKFWDKVDALNPFV